jgi:Carboxypeptidase regulatory-like domain
VNHLTPDQLTAHLDGAGTAATRAETERHLAECATCRAALADLTAMDASLGRALSHDPGEEYFASFAGRVEQRLRASGLRGAQSRGEDERDWAWMDWLRSPRKLAWLGAAAAVIGGAAIVLVTSREDRLSAIDESRSARESRARMGAPPAENEEAGQKSTEPATGAPMAAQQAAPARDQRAENAPVTPSTAARKPAPTTTGTLAGRNDAAKTAPAMTDERQADAGAASRAGAGPQRMMEVKKDADGNWVPVTPAPALARFAAPPGAAPPAPPSGGGMRVKKQNAATPLAAEKDLQSGASPEAKTEAPVAASEVAADKLEAGQVALCGSVFDASGRKIEGASVSLGATGHVTFTGADGRFCTGAPVGDQELIVHAVGFGERRLEVHVAGDQANVEITLDAVSVLGDGVKLAKDATPPGVAALAAKPPVTQGGSNADPFAGLPDSTRRAANDARHLSTIALGSRSAAAYELAAGRWERMLETVPEKSAAAAATRYRVAEARYGAWDVSHSADRARAAAQALDAFLASAPEGAQRDLALRWKAALGQ